MHGLDVTATVILIVVVAVAMLSYAVFLGLLAVGINKLNQKLEKLTNMAEPVASKASDTLDNIQRVTMSVGEKADQIRTRGVEMTYNVSGNVEKTATVVHQTVTTPLIKLSSVIAGMSRGFSVYTGRNNGHTNSSDSKE
jgi:predicted PurR-regulated permease PerM